MNSSIFQTAFVLLLTFGKAFGQSCSTGSGIQYRPDDSSCSCCTYSGAQFTLTTSAQSESACSVICAQKIPLGFYGFIPDNSGGGVCECKFGGTLTFQAGSFAGFLSSVCDQGVDNRPGLASCSCCAIEGGTEVFATNDVSESDCQSTCDGEGAEFYDISFSNGVSLGGDCRCINGGSTVFRAGSLAGTASGEPQNGVFGDPHIAKWNGQKYDFHGECDLVLLQAPDFADGVGLDVHIRTTIQNSYSYVEEVAIKAGSYVANVNNQGVWIDNELLTAFPAQYGLFRVTKQNVVDKQGKQVIIYELYAARHKAVRVKIPGTQFVFVSVVRHSQNMMSAVDNFRTSQGLMGQYGTGKTLGRDGWTEFVDMKEFGMEWQVQPYEEMLFLTVREPQFPSVCNMPTEKSDIKRILAGNPGLHEKAEQACDHADADMIEFCIQDVITTGDFSVAAGY